MTFFDLTSSMADCFSLDSSTSRSSLVDSDLEGASNLEDGPGDPPGRPYSSVEAVFDLEVDPSSRSQIKSPLPGGEGQGEGARCATVLEAAASAAWVPTFAGMTHRKNGRSVDSRSALEDDASTARPRDRAVAPTTGCRPRGRVRAHLFSHSGASRLAFAAVLVLGLALEVGAQGQVDRDHVPSNERVDLFERRQTDLDANVVRTTVFNFGQTGRTGAGPDEIPYEWPRNTRRHYIALTGLFAGAEVVGESGDREWIVDVPNYRTNQNNPSEVVDVGAHRGLRQPRRRGPGHRAERPRRDMAQLLARQALRPDRSGLDGIRGLACSARTCSTPTSRSSTRWAMTSTPGRTTPTTPTRPTAPAAASVS